MCTKFDIQNLKFESAKHCYVFKIIFTKILSSEHCNGFNSRNKKHPPKSYLSEVFVSRDRVSGVLLKRSFLAEKGKGVQGTKEKCITW